MVNKRTVNGVRCSKPIQSVLAELLLKCDIYSVSQKKVAPLKLFAIFSLTLSIFP